MPESGRSWSGGPLEVSRRRLRRKRRISSSPPRTVPSFSSLGLDPTLTFPKDPGCNPALEVLRSVAVRCAAHRIPSTLGCPRGAVGQDWCTRRSPLRTCRTMRGVSMRGWRLLPWLITYAVAMAYVESAVVVYLRAIYYPRGFSFPLAPMPPDMVAVEIGREIATLVMLLGLAMLAG